MRAWLFAIATNLLRDEIRARGRRRSLLDRLRSEPVAAVAPPLLDDPELASALRGLRREELEVLLLFAWAELSYDEIAAVLGIPVGTVRSRLSRARAHMRAAMEFERGVAGRPPTSTACAPPTTRSTRRHRRPRRPVSTR